MNPRDAPAPIPSYSTSTCTLLYSLQVYRYKEEHISTTGEGIM